ncbi:MAG: DUF6034 family protein [Acinetobacter sp.]
MMKKIRWVMLLAIMYLITNRAYAEPLAERLNVPAHVSEASYQTSTGFTTITLDAVVEIPNVSTVYTYEVAPRVFDEAEAKTIANAMGFTIDAVGFTEDRDEASWTYQNYWKETFRLTNQTHSLSITNSYVKNQPATALIQMHLQNPKAEYMSDGLLYPYQESNANGCKYSIEEATRMAMELAAKIAPDLTMNAFGILPGINIVTSSNPPPDGSAKVEDFPYGYGLIFTRTIDGIPVSVTRNQSAGNLDDSYSPPFVVEQLSIAISNVGVDNVRYDNPYEIKSILQESVPLISFDQVMSTALEIMPLKIVSMEGLNELITKVDNDVTIHHIKFGFMRVRMRNQPERYEMIPVWDFFASTIKRSFYRDEWHTNYDYGLTESLLTINATDGTIVDRDLGY